MRALLSLSCLEGSVCVLLRPLASADGMCVCTVTLPFVEWFTSVIWFKEMQ
jgi:hypothetical protein